MLCSTVRAIVLNNHPDNIDIRGGGFIIILIEAVVAGTIPTFPYRKHRICVNFQPGPLEQMARKCAQDRR